MRILLVEDSVTLATLFGVQLRELGHDLMTANTKAEAMNIFRRQSFDLVFVDIGLDGRQDTGLEILAEMKALVPEQRIGILSSNDLADMIRRSQANGAEFYMVKPYTMEGLSIILNGDETALQNYQPEIGSGRIIPFHRLEPPRI